MTPRDALEKEANDHAMEHACRTLYYKASKRDDFVAGYLQAAIAREQEVVGLRAKLTEAKAAIRWMHGHDEPGTEDFPICPEGKRYAWRGVSRQQFAIVREACSEPIPLPEGE